MISRRSIPAWCSSVVRWKQWTQREAWPNLHEEECFISPGGAYVSLVLDPQQSTTVAMLCYEAEVRLSKDTSLRLILVEPPSSTLAYCFLSSAKLH